MGLPANLEHVVPMENLRRALDRGLARCTRNEMTGCLVWRGWEKRRPGRRAQGGKNRVPQVRVKIAPAVSITLQAPRVVMAVKLGRVPAGDETVIRSCDTYGCVEESHLLMHRLGTPYPRQPTERQLEAGRRGSKKRRIYSDAQVRRLRKLVAANVTMTVTEAAWRVGMGRTIAYHIISGRARAEVGRRVVKRGSYGLTMCTRCGELGHRRSSPGCPQVAAHGG